MRETRVTREAQGGSHHERHEHSGQWEFASTHVGDSLAVFAEVCGIHPEGVLVVTDANGMFGTAVEIVQSLQLSALVPPMLVVGLGYPGATNLLDTIQVRARDLTPTWHEVFPQSGHADEFAAFIGDELRPWIAETYGDCSRNLTCFGHSLGGLFATHLLLTQPELFNHYIVSSPSLWWDDYVMGRVEQQRSESHDDLAAQVFFGVGGLETDEGRRDEGRKLVDGHPAKPGSRHLDMVEDLEQFVATIRGRGYESLDLELLVLPDEYHVTVAPFVLSRALRHFYP